MKYIEEEDAKFIRLVFRDAYGVQKNIAVMPGEIKKAFEDGIPINALQIAGFKDCPYASLYLRPDSSTLTVLPWRPESGHRIRTCSSGNSWRRTRSWTERSSWSSPRRGQNTWGSDTARCAAIPSW